MSDIVREPGSRPRTVRRLPARELSGAHIGQVISFHWLLPGGRTQAHLTGELREVGHSSGETVLALCSHTENVNGSTDQITLDPTTDITLEDF